MQDEMNIGVELCLAP